LNDFTLQIFHWSVIAHKGGRPAHIDICLRGRGKLIISGE